MGFQRFHRLLTAIVFGATAMLCAPALQAETLENLIMTAVEKHDRVRAAKRDVEAARQRAREALGDWYPVLTPTANYGWERQYKFEADNTSTAFEEFDLSMKQLLWDFGKTNATVEKARLTVETSQASLKTVRQNLLLEAVTAYVNLIRSQESLEFALQSESNIREQTELENARVETGAGLSTDVLQAKTQLASAQSRLIQSEGGVINARNRFEAVFGYVPDNISDLDRPNLSTLELPESLGVALDTALQNNPRLHTAYIDERTVKQTIKEVRGTEFMPKIEGTVERKWKNNVAGTLEFKGETLMKVEMSVPLNMGLTGLDALEAARHDIASKALTTADLVRTIREEVSNAWADLLTAQRNADALLNQAAISSAFLDLARQERELGQRSLIDVLSGETSLINAQSDALSAEADVIIAAYTLLSSMGTLEYASFNPGNQQADSE